MDIMTDLSIKIAEAAVPDEIDLAPLMTEAFVQGRKGKRVSFYKTGKRRTWSFWTYRWCFTISMDLKRDSCYSSFYVPIYINR